MHPLFISALQTCHFRLSFIQSWSLHFIFPSGSSSQFRNRLFKNKTKYNPTFQSYIFLIKQIIWYWQTIGHISSPTNSNASLPFATTLTLLVLRTNIIFYFHQQKLPFGFSFFFSSNKSSNINKYILTTTNKTVQTTFQFLSRIKETRYHKRVK